MGRGGLSQGVLPSSLLPIGCLGVMYDSRLHNYAYSKTIRIRIKFSILKRGDSFSKQEEILGQKSLFFHEKKVLGI
jgi:hypothetical protein